MSAPSSGRAVHSSGNCGLAGSEKSIRAGTAPPDPLSVLPSRALIAAGFGVRRRVTGRMIKTRTTTKQAACEDCFFARNLLCALQVDEPCPTFRPDSPDGLRPPQQLRFAFRQERRTQATWAFPSAQEQAALHAR